MNISESVGLRTQFCISAHLPDTATTYHCGGPVTAGTLIASDSSNLIVASLSGGSKMGNLSQGACTSPKKQQISGVSRVWLKNYVRHALLKFEIVLAENPF